MQLREIDEVYEQLRRDGVAVHAITAETGGESEIKSRLDQRDSFVSFPIHSDPEHKLLLRDTAAEAGTDKHSLYVKKLTEASQHGGTYEDYVLVQPALVVVDREGEIQQQWSWNTEPLNELEPKEETTVVAKLGGAPLVSVRPETADLGPSIREGRQVRLKVYG